MAERDYKVRDTLEDPVDYTRRKKKKKVGLVWDEYEVVSAISDIITRTTEPSEVRQLAMRLQSFIGNPEKYDPHWNRDDAIWALLGNHKEQRLQIAKELEKKLREDIRFKEYVRS